MAKPKKINSEKRTRNYLLQIKGAAVFKGLAFVSSFVAVPITLDALGSDKYGVWVTILSVVSWVSFFDFGIGNGVRNKVSELISCGYFTLARDYISVAYVTSGFLAGISIIALVFGLEYIPWPRILDSVGFDAIDVERSIQVAIAFILLNFCVGLVNPLLGAVQESSKVGRGQLIWNLLIIFFVFVLSRFGAVSLTEMSWIYGVSIFISNIYLSIIFYKKHKELIPVLAFDSNLAKPLINIGGKFFVIQLAVLIIFTTDKLIISILYGPSNVSEYEIVFKFFSIITLTHGMISGPLWSAYTEAHHTGDFEWMRSMIRNQLKVYLVVMIASVFFVISGKFLIAAWVGPMVEVSDRLILLMAFFVLVSAWNNVFAMVVNGIGEIKPQLYTSVVAMLVNIPLSIFFAKYLNLGLSGIVLGTTCSLLLPAVVLPIQVRNTLWKKVL